MNNFGVVLEGGAMRGVFTAGILDFFLDNDVNIHNVLAVSAGAFVGMNYVSKQRGRIMESVVEPMAHERIMSLGNLIKHGEFWDMDKLFGTIPKERAPFDFESFKNSGKRFITSTVNCDTGELVYHDSFKDLDEFLHICRVANSLPLLAKIGYIDGAPMLDGGMADAIPIAKALEENWDKTIVIFTRERDYRKSPKGDIYNSGMVRFLYRKYKGLLKVIDERPSKYNDSIELINRLEDEGKIFVFRPEGIILKNNERDADALKEYHRKGYEIAARRFEELKTFLNA